MVHVLIHTNGRARTVEEEQTHKRDMHLAAFHYLIAEIRNDLERIAEDERAADRLARDPQRDVDLRAWLAHGGRTEWLEPGMSDGERVAFTVEGLLARIAMQCEAVLERHKGVSPEL